MKSFKAVLLLGCLLVLTAGAWGESRPVSVTIPSPDGPGTDLQSILNAIYGPGVVNAMTGQVGAELFQALPPGSPFVGMQLTFEFAGNAPSNGFGIYEAGNPANNVLLFPGSAKPGDLALVTFAPNLIGNTATFLPLVSGVGGFSKTFSGISGSAFGTFLSCPIGCIGGGTSGGTDGIFTSQDVFNPGGLAQILTYFYNGETTFAAEDLQRYNGPSDSDFNDLIVIAQSIQPIPEPGALAMVGTGLILLAGLLRFKARHSS